VAVTVYSVYEPPAGTKDLTERADRLAFVKEGFSWLAFFIPLLWLLYHRMWIEFVVLLLIYVGVQFAVGADNQAQALSAWIGLAISVLFAFEANDLREASLRRRGYRFAGTASGRDRTDAERSFFNLWLPQQIGPARATEAMPAPLRETEIRPPLPHGEGEEVIGLFPRP
jgi:hypothetical protein